MPRFSFVFWILFLCLGPFFAIGIVGVVKTCLTIRHSHSAEGIVKDNVPRIFADGTAAYVPKIKFTTAAGKDTFFLGNTGAIPPAYEKGDKAIVLYNPLKPVETRINSFRDLWLEDACFIALSLLLFLIVRFIMPKNLL